MQSPNPQESYVAPMDVCLGGVFIGRGERIPPDLHEAWRKRLVALGLDRRTAPAGRREKRAAR